MQFRVSAGCHIRTYPAESRDCSPCASLHCCHCYRFCRSHFVLALSPYRLQKLAAILLPFIRHLINDGKDIYGNIYFGAFTSFALAVIFTISAETRTNRQAPHYYRHSFNLL